MYAEQKNTGLDNRKSDFKKTVDADEGRRRRADTTLKIRKEKKEQQLKKRREYALSTVSDTSFTVSLGQQQDNGGKFGRNEARPTIRDAPRLKEMLFSSVASTQTLVEATRGFRRILSVEKNIPARELVDMGIVPYLVRNLSVNFKFSSTSLIFESAWALTNIASTECTMDVVNAGCIKPICFLLSHGDANIREQAAWCLGNIAGEGPGLRDLVLQESAFEPLLWNLINPGNMSLLENVVWTISNLCRGTPSPPKEMTAPAIHPLVSLLEQPISDGAKVDILWALSYLSDGDEEKIELVLASPIGAPRGDVCFKLTHLLQDDTKNVKLNIPIVRILGNFVSGNESQTQVVLDSGILNHLSSLLGHRSKTIRKESSWLASNIACGSHNQITMLLKTTKILKQIIQNAKHDYWDVRKEALWALAHMCTSGTNMHTTAMVDAGGLEPLVAALSLKNIDLPLLLTILDAIRNILEVGQLFSNQNYEQLVDENNGIDYLEDLQTHPNEDVYKKVVGLIEDYFGVVDEGDENLAPKTNESGTFGFGFAPGLASPKQLFPSFISNESNCSSKDVFPFGNVSTNAAFPM